MIADQQGNAKVTITGAFPADAFITKVKNELNPELTPERMKQRYESGERTPELVNAYAMDFMEKKKYDAKMNLALKVLDNADNPDKFTKKDLEQLKAGTLDLIVNEALIFSGLDNLESMDNNIAEFREEE